jgi:hypothetical protein
MSQGGCNQEARSSILFDLLGQTSPTFSRMERCDNTVTTDHPAKLVNFCHFHMEAPTTALNHPSCSRSICVLVLVMANNVSDANDCDRRCKKLVPHRSSHLARFCNVVQHPETLCELSLRLYRSLEIAEPFNARDVIFDDNIKVRIYEEDGSLE